MANDISKRLNKWLNSEKVELKDKELLKSLTKEQLDDAFYKDVEFGTAGMRGVLGPGDNRLNDFTITKANYGFGLYLLKKYPNVKKQGVVISSDNRHQSRHFVLLCANILNDLGINAYIFDSLRPTPELSFAVRYLNACGGIMITASHNPKQYNGYKVYDEQGCQLVPEKIKDLVDTVNSLGDALDLKIDVSDKKGETITLNDDIDKAYLENVKSIQINPLLPKKGFKIVYSPQHGAASMLALRLFKELGYDFYPYLPQCSDDPDFSNTLSPNPEDPKAYTYLIKYAKEINADLILCNDPDGDRVGVGVKNKDGEYVLINGNQGACLLMEYIFSNYIQKNIMPKDPVMYTTVVSSSLGLKIAENYHVKVEQFLTGFKFIGEQIHHYEVLDNGPTFVFGYEESYGCLIKPFVRDKDGLQAILMYSEMALYYHQKGLDLLDIYDNLQRKYGYHIDVTLSKEFVGSKGNEEMLNLMKELHENPIKSLNNVNVFKVEDYLKKISICDNEIKPINLPSSDLVKLYFEDGSIISTRPSGTEPKCKFYISTVKKTYDEAVEANKRLQENFFNYLKI